MHIREVAPTELACCMRSCVRRSVPSVRTAKIQSWLRRKRARSQRCSFESPSVAYDSPEHCQSTKHGSTSNRTTSQKIKVRVYPITCPLCKGLVTSERMWGARRTSECETWAQYEKQTLYTSYAHYGLGFIVYSTEHLSSTFNTIFTVESMALYGSSSGAPELG